MNRFDGVEEKEMYEILDRMTSKNDFWAVAKPFPEKIGFQRFGLQLREEDFERDGVSYRGFFLRDRNEVRKATSGFSVVRDDEKEFKVELDVWPFKRDELFVMVVPGRYFTIKGEHEEKFEDNSDCTRKFQRYYCLPRGSDTIECSYCNGTLTITVEKRGVSDETRGPQTVPINLVTCSDDKGVPIEEQHPPTEIRNVPTTNDDLQNDVEPVEKAMEPPKEVPVTKEDLKREFLPRAVETYKEELAALVDLVNKAIKLTMKSWRGALASDEDSKSDSDVITKATESLKETIIAYVDLMDSTESLREGLFADKDYKSDNVVVTKVLGSFKETIETSVHLMNTSVMDAVKSTFSRRLFANQDVVAEATETLRERLIANVHLINSTVMNGMESSREQLFAIEDSKIENEAVQRATEPPKEVPVTKEDLKRDLLPRTAERLKETLATQVDLVNNAVMHALESSRGALATDEDSKSDCDLVMEATECLKKTIVAYLDLMDSAESLREGLVADKDYKSDNVVVTKVLGSFKETYNTILDLMTKTIMHAIESTGKRLFANQDVVEEATESLRERLIANVYLINSKVMENLVSSREQLFAIEDSKSDNEAVQRGKESSEKGTIAYDHSNVDIEKSDKEALTSDDGK